MLIQLMPLLLTAISTFLILWLIVYLTILCLSDLGTNRVCKPRGFQGMLLLLSLPFSIILLSIAVIVSFRLLSLELADLGLI